jgi:hypothetical protein
LVIGDVSIRANLGCILERLKGGYKDVGEQKKAGAPGVLFIVSSQHLHCNEFAKVRPGQIDRLVVMMEVLLP